MRTKKGDMIHYNIVGVKYAKEYKHYIKEKHINNNIMCGTINKLAYYSLQNNGCKRTLRM